ETADKDGAQLQGCVTVEQLNSSGQATRRQVIRKASVILGRNEFQEILLRVHDGKIPQNYHLKEFKLFTKFVRDGSAPSNCSLKNIQLLLSNCPPDQLRLFLKTLSIKHQAWQSSKPLTGREKLRAGLPRSFEAISPLQQKDIQKVNELRSKVPPKGLTDRTNKTTVAGTGQQVKRSPSFLPSRKLNKEQAAVLSAVLSGKNVFFTGSAGTGKSFLLKRIIGSLPPKSTFATASTGVAACHIGGTTITQLCWSVIQCAPEDQIYFPSVGLFYKKHRVGTEEYKQTNWSICRFQFRFILNIDCEMGRNTDVPLLSKKRTAHSGILTFIFISD
uniref:ATP-dependent DNA helicase n=1 Tax=Amphiprion ocellaris TaxID=80972 RepID=A0AAQ6A3Y0_AMPOC